MFHTYAEINRLVFSGFPKFTHAFIVLICLLFLFARRKKAFSLVFVLEEWMIQAFACC